MRNISLHKKIQLLFEKNSLYVYWFLIVLLYTCSIGTTISLHEIHFIFLAQAFLHGHFNIVNAPWLNELVLYKQKYFVVYPPLPAFLLIPLLPFFGIASQLIASILLGATNCILAFKVFEIICKKKYIAMWISVLYAFGTVHWYHAVIGTSWLFAHIVGLFFLWLLIYESLSTKRVFLLGLYLGAAYLSRLPLLFAIFYLVPVCFPIFDKNRIPVIKTWLQFFSGLFPFLFFNAFYNYSRFGSIFDVGYTLLVRQHRTWFPYGLFSIWYIPVHVQEMLLSHPHVSINPPFLIPSLYATAIWITTPAIILVFRAPFKHYLTKPCLLAIVAIAIPSLIYGYNGASQFGYRYSLDYTPFLFILICLGMGLYVTRFEKFLILLSIGINLWGIVMINYLQIYLK